MQLTALILMCGRNREMKQTSSQMGLQACAARTLRDGTETEGKEAVFDRAREKSHQGRDSWAGACLNEEGEVAGRETV